MPDFIIKARRKTSNVFTPGVNANIVDIPEDEEIVREREFQRRLKKEIDENVESVVEERIRAMRPKILADKEEAYAKGLAEGKDEGLQLGLKDIEPVKVDFMNTMKKVEEFENEFIKQAEDTIVKMAFAFAKNIIKKTIKEDPEVIREQVKEALSHINDIRNMKIKVNPHDVAQFDYKEQFILEDYVDSITLIVDERVEPGGCIIETNSGLVDATIQTQIAELAENLESDMESRFEPDTE